MNLSHIPAHACPSSPAGRPGGRARHRQQGFTLTELLVVVGVLSVLTAVATPSLSRLIDSSRLTSYSNGFLSAMYLARSEAIKRNGRVGLCKSTNGLGCSAGGGWEQGWIVFHDSNDNGVADAGEPVIHSSQALPTGFRLSGNRNVAQYISFVPSGRNRLASGAFQAGTLTLCRQSGTTTEGRQIVINDSGRARVEKVPSTICI